MSYPSTIKELVDENATLREQLKNLGLANEAAFREEAKLRAQLAAAREAMREACRQMQLANNQSARNILENILSSREGGAQ